MISASDIANLEAFHFVQYQQKPLVGAINRQDLEYLLATLGVDLPKDVSICVLKDILMKIDDTNKVGLVFGSCDDKP